MRLAGLTTPASSGSIFGVLLAHERFGDAEHAASRRRVRRPKDHADAIVLRPRARRFRQELGHLDTERARQPDERLERGVRVRGGSAAQYALEPRDRLDGYARARCKLGLSEPSFEAELLDVICKSVRNVGQ